MLKAAEGTDYIVIWLGLSKTACLLVFLSVLVVGSWVSAEIPPIPPSLFTTLSLAQVCSVRDLLYVTNYIWI